MTGKQQTIAWETSANSLLSEEDLKRWTGYKQRSKIEKFCKMYKVKTWLGQGNRILTTEHEFRKTGLVPPNAAQEDDGFF